MVQYQDEATTKPKINALTLRILASLVMMPAMLGAIYLGRPIFEGVLVIMVGILLWEWQGMIFCDRALARNLATFGGVGVFIASALHPFSIFAVWPLALIVGLYSARYAHTRKDTVLMAFGPLYVVIPCFALMLLRNAYGVEATFWFFAMIWATDIGAYGFGRVIGGAKLAPQVSPNKTWAGLGGGMLCAAIVSLAAAELSSLPQLLSLPNYSFFVIGACAAVIAQIGDLFESAIKRRAGVKDSSQLIPGHGGVLDRVDGVLTAAPALLCFLLLMSSLAG